MIGGWRGTLIFRNLTKFKKIHARVSTATCTVLQRHTWYLTEDLIRVSLFNEAIPAAERTLHAKKLYNLPATEELPIMKPVLPALSTSSQISDYIGERSRILFDLLGVPLDYLADDNWMQRPEYSTVKTALKNFSPLNDSAERALSLMTTYDTNITRTEALFQELLQVV